jgi:hypothetical protein
MRRERGNKSSPRLAKPDTSDVHEQPTGNDRSYGNGWTFNLVVDDRDDVNDRA